MAVADRSLAPILQQRMGPGLRSIDLQRLSKVDNHQLPRYEFSIGNILQLPKIDER